MTISEMRRAELATKATLRRAALGLTYAEISARSGLARDTIMKIMHGERVRELSYAGLDRALGWRPGSSLRYLLTGEEPQEEGENGQQSVTTR